MSSVLPRQPKCDRRECLSRPFSTPLEERFHRRPTELNETKGPFLPIEDKSRAERTGRQIRHRVIISRGHVSHFRTDFLDDSSAFFLNRRTKTCLRDREGNENSTWLLNGIWSLFAVTVALAFNALSTIPGSLADSRTVSIDVNIFDRICQTRIQSSTKRRESEKFTAAIRSFIAFSSVASISPVV